jgi:hypothetical protein
MVSHLLHTDSSVHSLPHASLQVVFVTQEGDSIGACSLDVLVQGKKVNGNKASAYA